MKTKITLMTVMMAVALTVSAMPFTDAREKSLFLSDKMAYELNLTEAQLEAVYEINLDYFLGVDDESDVFGCQWEIRNRDLGHVLSDLQYNHYIACDWLSKPFVCDANGWSLAVNERYKEGKYLMDQPEVAMTYQGGHNQIESSFYAGKNFDSPQFLGQND